MRAFLLAFAALLLILASPARLLAEASPQQVSEEWRALGEGVVTVRATSAPGAGGASRMKVALRKLDLKLAPDGDAVTVYDGVPVGTALAVRDGAAAVAIFRGGAQPFVKVALIDLASRAVRVVDLERTAGREYEPAAAIACAEPDGFTVLWQEQKRGDPQAEALSTLAHVKADGALVGKPAAVPIPWSLGAIVDDGRGYTLAVNYDGAAPDQTRVCFVTLTRDGKPEQHPWWGSRPSLVEEVQLVSVAGKVTAVFRSGGALLSVVADKGTGQWGKEAEPSKALSTSQKVGAPFAVRVTGGVVAVVK